MDQCSFIVGRYVLSQKDLLISSNEQTARYTCFAPAYVRQYLCAAVWTAG